MEEAVSGVKGELAIKIYGDDLKTLEEKGDEIVRVMRTIAGIAGSRALFRVLGQPNLNFTVDRAGRRALSDQRRRRAGRDPDRRRRQRPHPGAAGRAALRPGAALSADSTANSQEAIENIRLLSPSGERVSLAQLCTIQAIDGASEVYREGNQRYVAIKYGVRGRDLGSAVEEAITKVDASR